MPTAVNVLASGAYVYVTAYDSSTPSPVGYVFGFSVGTGGVLTPLNGGTPFPAGAALRHCQWLPPSRGGRHFDKLLSLRDGFEEQQRAGIFSCSEFSLGSGRTDRAKRQSLPGRRPAFVGDRESLVSFVYATNSEDSTIEAYSISTANGQLSFLGNSSTPVTFATGLQPVAIGIDPSTNHFLYTVNFLGSNVSGFELSPTQGTLLVSQYSPFGTNAQPVAVAAVPHNGTGGGVQ